MTTMNDDSISRQAAIDGFYEMASDMDHLCTVSDYVSFLESLPSAESKYEPVTVEDFAKTMSENTPYGFMAWHGEAFTLIKEIGFEICKKTM